MPLYIKDDTVDELAIEYMRLSGAKNKTDAVRTALMNQVSALKTKSPLSERIKPSRALVTKIGKPDVSFDQKAFSDALYEGM